MPDSPVDLSSPSGRGPRPDTGAEVTETFNGDDGAPWAGATTSELETPALGSVLELGELGAFKLEARLGRGGMGEVYRARQIGAKGFSQIVAVKRMRPGHREWEERSFVDEARVLSLLHHENIARVYGFFELKGDAYLVMEYIEGQTLYALLEQARRRGARFSEKAACLIAADVADALHYAHHAVDDAGRPLQIVHRDVSTTNILISSAGRTKLVDFGVAYSKLDGRTQTSASSTVIKGKAPYLSPEQVKQRPVDGRSDLFSLGTILVEMLTGEAPFGWAADLATLKRIADVTPEFVATATAAVSKELRAICQRLLQREPGSRFANGEEVARALREHAGRSDGRSHVKAEVAKLQGLVSTAPAIRELTRARRSVTLAGAAVFLVVALLSWRTYRSDLTTMHPPEQTTPPEAQPYAPSSCWKALALAHVVTIAACQAHLPRAPNGDGCSARANREVLGPQGMTALPEQVRVEFVSFKGDQVCEGEPYEYDDKPGGAPGELVPVDRGVHEPCPYGDGPVVARISWEDARADVFSPGLGAHRWDRPLLLGEAHITPPGTGKIIDEEVLREPGREDDPRVGIARMTVLFTYIQMQNGNKYPVCGVLYWQDGKEGIPVLAEQYYGKRAAAEWGNGTYVQFYFP